MATKFLKPASTASLVLTRLVLSSIHPMVVLTAILAILKGTVFPSLPWLWVLSPVWAPYAFVLFLLTLGLGAALGLFLLYLAAEVCDALDKTLRKW